VTVDRSALVLGAAGQDGSYLVELLLERGYRVVGVVRDATTDLANLAAVRERIDLVHADLRDTERLAEAVAEHEPAEIYNVAFSSFGPDAWENAPLALELGASAVARLLEAARTARHPPRLFQASSAWVFGRPSESPQSERTPYAPVEPYGVAKAAGDFLVRAYRERYGLFACSGLLYNHESPRRSPRFVTRKVTRAAAAISAGRESELRLGDLDARRDWGYAPDYVRAAWLMLQAEEPRDYVVATGETHTVRELVELAFTSMGLRVEDHVRVDPELARPTGQVADLVGDASAARSELGWAPTVGFEELVRSMVESDLERLS
jgi:GDPmannose 4,6-dehydratase